MAINLVQRSTDVAPQREQQTPKLAAALDYAKRGWRVIPIHWVRKDGTCSCANPHCDNVGNTRLRRTV